MDENFNKPILTEEQIRVLGVLMEKSKTTPDYYPMTINGLMAGCNQKTSRKPVVNYNEETISLTLNALKIAGLISTVTGGSSRNTKYKHNFAIVYPLVPAEIAVMCLLFLRGPQTPGEINTNAGRLYEFGTLEEVSDTLERLKNDGYVKQLEKRAGQKEQRYIHLFTDNVDFMEDNNIAEHNQTSNYTALEERIEKLEAALADMKETLAKVLKDLY